MTKYLLNLFSILIAFTLGMVFTVAISNSLLGGFFYKMNQLNVYDFNHQVLLFFSVSALFGAGIERGYLKVMSSMWRWADKVPSHQTEMFIMTKNMQRNYYGPRLEIQNIKGGSSLRSRAVLRTISSREYV